MQPTHATSDMTWRRTRVGPERIKGAYAWRKLLDAGARLAGGSDFPVELPNPFSASTPRSRARIATAGRPAAGIRRRG